MIQMTCGSTSTFTQCTNCKILDKYNIDKSQCRKCKHKGYVFKVGKKTYKEYSIFGIKLFRIYKGIVLDRP